MEDHSVQSLQLLPTVSDSEQQSATIAPPTTSKRNFSPMLAALEPNHIRNRTTDSTNFAYRKVDHLLNRCLPAMLPQEIVDFIEDYKVWVMTTQERANKEYATKVAQDIKALPPEIQRSLLEELLGGAGVLTHTLDSPAPSSPKKKGGGTALKGQ